MVKRKSNRTLWGGILLSLVLGAVFGVFSSFVNQDTNLKESLIGSIAQTYGYWVILAAVLIITSKKPMHAGINCIVFFFVMNTCFYAYEWLLTGGFQTMYYIRWIMFSLLTFIAGVVIWQYKRGGWLGALCISLPMGLLMREVVQTVYYMVTNPAMEQKASIFNMIIYMAFIVFLFVYIPAKKHMKLKTGLFVLIFTAMWWLQFSAGLL